MSVAIKAIKVTQPELVSDKTKQDVYVADATGSIRLTLWQEDINKLDVNQSYLLKNVNVSIKSSSTSLSLKMMPLLKKYPI